MLESIGVFAAKSIISYAAKKGLSKLFPNEKSFSSHLEKVIEKTIAEYKTKYPIPLIHQNLREYFPFYDSQIIIDKLLKLVFFEKNEFGLQSNNIIEALNNNSNIIPPTEEQITKFLDLFKMNIIADSELKSLAIEENYKEEIFKMSEKMNKLLNRPTIQNIIPKEITPISKISKEDIVGREHDLKNLRKLLLENKKIALINGMGGIGKTTLASVYINEYYSEYSHIVWLALENNLGEAIISNYSLLKNLKIDSEKSNVMVEACLNELRKLENEKPNILILDNANKNLSEYYDKLPGSPHWHTLVTSREIISPFHIIDLDFLSEEEANNLFKKYCNKYSDSEIKEIVNKVEFHTLTIEILSKSAQRNSWTFKYVNEAFEKDAKVGVNTEHSKKEKIERIKSYLSNIFDLNKLCENEIYVLKQFVAFPNIWIEIETLNVLLQVNKLQWKDDFNSTIEDIFEKGYIQKNEPIKSYKLHPVLSEILAFKLKPSLDDCKLLIIKVANLMHIDEVKDNPIEKFKYIPYGDKILLFFKENNSTELSSLQNNFALIYRDFGNYNKAHDLLTKALQSNLERFGESSPIVAINQSNLATVFKELGEYEKAKALLEKSLQTNIINYGEEHHSVAKVQSNLALIFSKLGNYKKSLYYSEKALKTEIAINGNDHPNLSNIRSNMALVYKELGEYEKARDLMETALKSKLEIFNDNHPNIATYRSNLALIYKELGEYKKACNLLQQALKSDIENFGIKHPIVATRQSNLATVYQDLGEFENACDLLEKALKSDIENFGENHPNVTNSMSNLATVFHNLEKHDKACELLEKVLQLDIEKFGVYHPNVVASQSNLGVVYLSLQNYKKSLELLEKALYSSLKIFGEYHPCVSTIRVNLAIVYQNMNDYEKARNLLEEALKSDLINLGDEHPSVANTKHNLAFIYSNLGDFKKAYDLWSSAYQILKNANLENNNLGKIIKDSIFFIKKYI